MSLLTRVKSILNNRSADKEHELTLQNEIRTQERIAFEKEYRRKAFEAAKIKAKIDAENKVGLAKLRAIAKEQSLQHKRPSKGFLSRLGEYTQANMERREALLQRTAKLRSAAKADRERRMRENVLRTKMNLERTALLRKRHEEARMQGIKSRPIMKRGFY